MPPEYLYLTQNRYFLKSYAHVLSHALWCEGCFGSVSCVSSLLIFTAWHWMATVCVLETPTVTFSYTHMLAWTGEAEKRVWQYTLWNMNSVLPSKKCVCIWHRRRWISPCNSAKLQVLQRTSLKDARLYLAASECLFRRVKAGLDRNKEENI